MLLLNGVWGCFDKKFNGLFVLLKSVVKLKDNMELHVIRTLRCYALQSDRYFYGTTVTVCVSIPDVLRVSKENRQHMQLHSDTPIKKNEFKMN